MPTLGDLPPSHFDHSAKDWDRRPTSLQLAPVPIQLLERMTWGADDRVLDFGSGTGLLATAIAPKVQQVTALDMSAAMLDVLAAKGVANIVPVQGDVAHFAKAHPAEFDAIVSCMALHHVRDTAALLADFAHLLKKGGRVALVDLYAEDGSFHGTPEDNQHKGVQHHGFEPAHLTALATVAGLKDIAFDAIGAITQRNGRSYPLFLMTGAKV